MAEQKIKNKKPNDFPESQIGFPERNDVRDPNVERERVHVNLENFQLERTTADGHGEALFTNRKAG